MINTSIYNIIINKLFYIKKLCLIILSEINKSLKVGFHYIILLFDLIIYLWLKDSKKSLLNTKKNNITITKISK